MIWVSQNKYKAEYIRKQFISVLKNDLSGCLMQNHLYGCWKNHFYKLAYILMKFFCWRAHYGDNLFKSGVIQFKRAFPPYHIYLNGVALNKT